MGQVRLRARSGVVRDAALALEQLVPADIAGLASGRQRYTQFTNAQGGILDDLMVTRLGDDLLVVINAACKAADIAHMRAHLSDTCTLDVLEDRALLALQGPLAGQVLAALAPAVADMLFMDVRALDIAGAACVVSRSGYTGEDGFEISVPAAQAEALARTLLAQPGVAPIGLGARDSLRLEAGLCLYGADIDETTTPVEAALEWSIQKSRRAGGVRAGGFPGAEIILAQLSEGTARRRVGLLPEGRAPVRGGAGLFADATLASPVGKVTSGGFGPTVDAPVAMGYVSTALAQPGQAVAAELRGRAVPCTVHALPFVPAGFRRTAG